MIDGTLFEGIDSFTLCPVYSVDDRLVSLPIQTFLPFLWYLYYRKLYIENRI